MKRLSVSALLCLSFLFGAWVQRTEAQTPVPTSRSSEAPANATPSAPQTAGSSPEEIGDDDVVRVDTTLVTVPLKVVDRDGKYIPDLRREDFRLFEDDAPQEIAYFASVEKPFTVALLIDTSGSTRFRLEEMQAAAISFVNQLRPEDRVMVVSFDYDVRVLAEPTDNREKLEKAIRSTKTGGGTRLYDAVDSVINRHFSRIAGRKAIVLFTDGIDTASNRATFESNLRDAEELDALIYPVQYSAAADVSRAAGNNSSEDYWLAVADAYLRDLARRTGARLYQADSLSTLTESFALIAEELRRQYSLGYYPKTSPQAGQRRIIKVRVGNPLLIVRARSDYVLSQRSNAKKQAEERLLSTSLSFRAGEKAFAPKGSQGAERGSDWRTSAFTTGDINIRLTPYFGNDPVAGSFLNLLLHVNAHDLAFTEETDGWHKANVLVIATTTDKENLSGSPVGGASRLLTLRGRGASYQRVLQNGLSYNLKISLKQPGAHQLRLVVRDTKSGRVGYASRFVKVPDLRDKRLVLSGIIISGKDQAAGGPPGGEDEKMAETGADPQAGPAVRRFRPGMTINYWFVIYNARLKKERPQLTTQLRIYRDGREVYTGQATAFDGGQQQDMKRLLSGGELQFNQAAKPGAYTLQIIVTDTLAKESDRTNVQSIDFEIIR